MKAGGDFIRAWGGIAALELSLPAVWTGAAARGVPIDACGRMAVGRAGAARRRRWTQGFDRVRQGRRPRRLGSRRDVRRRRVAPASASQANALRRPDAPRPRYRNLRERPAGVSCPGGRERSSTGEQGRRSRSWAELTGRHLNTEARSFGGTRRAAVEWRPQAGLRPADRSALANAETSKPTAHIACLRVRLCMHSNRAKRGCGRGDRSLFSVPSPCLCASVFEVCPVPSAPSVSSVSVPPSPCPPSPCPPQSL